MNEESTKNKPTDSVSLKTVENGKTIYRPAGDGFRDENNTVYMKTVFGTLISTPIEHIEKMRAEKQTKAQNQSQSITPQP